jgi:hypothetical protein
MAGSVPSICHLARIADGRNEEPVFEGRIVNANAIKEVTAVESGCLLEGLR